MISIHALREEGDWVPMITRTSSCDFYPRPPRGGRRSYTLIIDPKREFLSTPSARRATTDSSGKTTVSLFLSTPSARRATLIDGIEVMDGVFLSTPSARRATTVSLRFAVTAKNFYPRPPRGGRRALGFSGRKRRNFYPRPPRGGRPQLSGVPLRTLEISIHALREEGDFLSFSRSSARQRFLSTPSARRATRPHRHRLQGGRISIHALREEGDIA